MEACAPKEEAFAVPGNRINVAKLRCHLRANMGAPRRGRRDGMERVSRPGARATLPALGGRGHSLFGQRQLQTHEQEHVLYSAF